jgi:hypothetical protein
MLNMEGRVITCAGVRRRASHPCELAFGFLPHDGLPGRLQPPGAGQHRSSHGPQEQLQHSQIATISARTRLESLNATQSTGIAVARRKKAWSIWVGLAISANG